MADDTEPVSTPDHLPEAAADRVRAVVIRVVAELDDRASVEVTETDEEIRCVIDGEDVGLVIGKHGTTIDALQHLASRSTFVALRRTRRSAWRRRLRSSRSICVRALVPRRSNLVSSRRADVREP